MLPLSLVCLTSNEMELSITFRVVFEGCYFAVVIILIIIAVWFIIRVYCCSWFVIPIVTQFVNQLLSYCYNEHLACECPTMVTLLQTQLAFDNRGIIGWLNKIEHGVFGTFLPGVFVLPSLATYFM